jgi:hypothetical protein
MAKRLIELTSSRESGFYLDDMDMLAETLRRLEDAGKKVILLGVSFALLDLAEKFDISLQNTIVMETGGMKGRRKGVDQGGASRHSKVKVRGKRDSFRIWHDRIVVTGLFQRRG